MKVTIMSLIPCMASYLLGVFWDFLFWFGLGFFERKLGGGGAYNVDLSPSVPSTSTSIPLR